MAPPLNPIDGTSVVNSLPLEVVYTTDIETVEKWIQDHASPTNLLGFDTESVPRANFLSYGRRPHSEKEGPATLQLATIDSCLIVHLAQCRWKKVPEALRDLLKDPSILKAGVGIDDDALELFRSSWTLHMNGRFDLGCILEGSSPQQRMGLGKLLAETSGLALPKSKKITMSNWGAKKLTEKQMVYAAYDAWTSVKIVDSLPQLNVDDISTTLEEKERPMDEIDVCSRTRKKAKAEWKKLREMEGEWTPEQRMQYEKLSKVMAEMRPDPPIMFHISIPSR